MVLKQKKTQKKPPNKSILAIPFSVLELRSVFCNNLKNNFKGYLNKENGILKFPVEF